MTKCSSAVGAFSNSRRRRLHPAPRRGGRPSELLRQAPHPRPALLALTDERGKPLWISTARPERSHDATAARHDKIVEHLKAAGLGALSDLGFLGVDNPDDPDDLVIVTGFKPTRWCKLTPGQTRVNRALAAGRAPDEDWFAHLKNWRTLDKLRIDPARATHLLLLRAPLVLTDFEVNR
ncbi:transposase family protein [Streptomyces uncialis]|uniref:transposase family protein n=1 Tax=Streptomyces uncialis TaxID=1048205 RepID=UPI0033EC395A